MTLYVFGAVFELGGIVMLAAPDWNTYTKRLSGWTQRFFYRLRDRLRRLLRLPRHVTMHAGSGSFTVSGTATASGIVGISADAPIDEKVEFLLRRDEQAQREADKLRGRVEAIERESPEKLDALRRELQVHVATTLEAEKADYRAGRALGAFALVVGLALSTAGNLVR